LLSRGQEALQDGETRRALKLFERHRRRFPNGVMAEERELKRIETLCALGRVDAARSAAQAFSRRFPSSALRDKARSGCDAR